MKKMFILSKYDFEEAQVKPGYLLNRKPWKYIKGIYKVNAFFSPWTYSILIKYCQCKKS